MSIKLAIVGMESIVGSCQGIDALVDSSYEGRQHICSDSSRGPGVYLADFEVDAFELKIPPKDLDRLTPQQLLLLTLLYRATRHSISSVDKIGAIYAADTRTIPSAQSLSEDRVGDRSAVKTLRQTVSEEDVVTVKLSHLLRCPVLPLPLEPTSDFLFHALNRAQLMLTAGEVGAVVIGALNVLPQTQLAENVQTSSLAPSPGEGSAVIAIKSYEKAVQANDHIYGVIEAVSEPSSPLMSAVDYIEVIDPGAIDDWPAGLMQRPQAADASEGDRLSCAVGSVKTILGDTGGMAGLLGLIHAAVCLYHRYLPPVPQWQTPRSPELWAASPFYVATAARPWLAAGGQARRAALSSRHGHVVMAEAHHPHQPRHQSLPVNLFVLGGADQGELLAQLATFEQRLSQTDNLTGLAREISLSAQFQADYVLALVGATPDKLLREIERARTGIQRAFARHQDWKSPAGSYFSANPLGPKGGVSFVYPGAFNAYLGMGRSLFHRFPQLFDRADRLTADPLSFFWGQQLYPKSQHRLSKRELEARAEEFTARPLAPLETGTGFSVLFTEIIHQIFQVKPRSAFGYSMGESTMMYALDVWPNADYVHKFIHRSSLFRAQLAGSQTVIRDRWPDADGLRWASYVLLTTPDQVRACLQQIPQVYLTHINTPQEVVIAGCAEQCDRVIAALQCDAFRSPANLVLHCDAMASAYPDLFDLNHVPGLSPSPIQFYSSATYRPLPLEPKVIAQHLATAICQPLDFPQLVNQVYDDGDRIFIELGAGGSCTRWIDQILAGKDHAVMGINRRGAEDYTTIVKVLAQLVSHKVPLDLSPLYPQTAVRNRLPQRISWRDQAASKAVVSQPDKTTKKESFNAAEVLEHTQTGVSRLFGADYAAVDSYVRRVRLPSPPFLFVSRVTALSGDRADYKTGVVETEYDIPEAAWYRHRPSDPLPLGICAEAGHGLLLLLSYLGTDFESRGQRSFRLLDLSNEFSPLPDPPKTLRYRVKITGHVKTTKSLLIFFEGECWAGETLWMKCSGGCAGLFSDQELAQGQGIVGESSREVLAAASPTAFTPLLFAAKTALNAQDLRQMSQGDLSVLGDAYSSTAHPSLRLPPDQLMMIDRVLSIDSTGGSTGLGQLMGTKAITPKDWYFQCHFKNDPTLPGSLMVEGGAQLLQVYMLWLGLQTRTHAAVFQPLSGRKMAFQFRGQVTPAVGTLHYQLDVIEIGLEPTPYAIANIRVRWADKTIAMIDNLALQISGEEIAPQPAASSASPLPAASDDAQAHLSALESPCYVFQRDQQLYFTHQIAADQKPLYSASALPPEQLGDAAFRAAYGVRYAYMAGAMANGISSAKMVIALGQAGLLASFGAAGLVPRQIEAAIAQIQTALPHGPYAFNLIHSPSEVALERNAVDLYLKYGVSTVEASAFLSLTLDLVRYRVSGLSLDAAGQVKCQHRVIAKLSRLEVAQQFLQPAPAKLLRDLVRQGAITEQQAALAVKVPMADDITVEADSGGHTDNRPLVCLLPAVIALRDQMQQQYGYTTQVRVGAAGGIGTPDSALAAFAMGASYIVTGSVNQACVESGTSAHIKQLLAQAEMADVTMAPSADMFEMGVNVQLLKRGTLFPMRAQKLYDLYQRYDSIDHIDRPEREKLEQQIFGKPLETVWQETVAYFNQRDPKQIVRAQNHPKRKMALIFRWYLGLSSHWAIQGEASRKLDCQIWCGPAMGAFNSWVKGTYLEEPAARRVVDVAHHLMVGAAYRYRLQHLRLQGLSLPVADRGYRLTPRPSKP